MTTFSITTTRKAAWFRAFALLFVLGISLNELAFAQQKPASPPATATTTFDGITATVNYGQPSKKGREIFGKLVPFGEVWRTGANGATTLTLSGDAMLGGKAVKAGTYGLFTIPTKDKWTIILNTDSKQWGAYEYKKDKDVLRVDVPSAATKELVESFTISFEKAEKGATMTLAWDMTKVSVALTK
ncbi:MAG: DUF2911 domain-containing protein [Candidatus Kapaibacterium sp.]|nr:MAG: DUF2911 domain-containing protein [Candidatus Kapabacteria bacterium]